MTTISLFTIGFSIIIAMTLFISYVFFIEHVNKTWLTIASCAGLLGGLSQAQYFHYTFYLSGTDPLSTLEYRFLILLLPAMFYFFSRAILFPDRTVSPQHLLHFLPLTLAFIARSEEHTDLALKRSIQDLSCSG